MHCNLISHTCRPSQEDCLAPVGSTPQIIAPDHSKVVTPRIRQLSSSDSDGGGLPSSSGKFGMMITCSPIHAHVSGKTCIAAVNISQK